MRISSPIFLYRTIILCLFLYLPTQLLGGPTKCDVCKKSVSGQYLSSSNKIYCSQKCFSKTLPSCSLCGRKSNGGAAFQYDGKFLCSKKCLIKKMPKCSICKNTLAGKKGLRSEGKSFCSQKCFVSSLKPCFICGKKEKESYQLLENSYCRQCYAKPKCDQCGLPSEGWPLEDGRHFCKACNRIGLRDEREAKKIYLEVKNLMLEKFGIKTSDDISFYMMDQNGFKKVKSDFDDRETGFYRREVIKETTMTSNANGQKLSEQTKVKSITRSIYILNFQSEANFRKVCAHELMHDWKANNYPHIKNSKISEGLSEYAASIINTHYGNEKLNDKMQNNKDPVYGDGYRLVKAKDKGNGLKDIIQWLDSL